LERFLPAVTATERVNPSSWQCKNTPTATHRKQLSFEQYWSSLATEAAVGTEPRHLAH